MDGGVSSPQISKPHDVCSVKSPTLQMIALKPDFLAAQVLNAQVYIFIGSVETDKKHVHEM